MKTIFLIFTALIIAGCSVFPKSMTSNVNRDITMEQVQTNPERYAGQKVLWGGIILTSENLEFLDQTHFLEFEGNDLLKRFGWPFVTQADFPVSRRKNRRNGIFPRIADTLRLHAGP